MTRSWEAGASVTKLARKRARIKDLVEVVAPRLRSPVECRRRRSEVFKLASAGFAWFRVCSDWRPVGRSFLSCGLGAQSPDVFATSQLACTLDPSHRSLRRSSPSNSMFNIRRLKIAAAAAAALFSLVVAWRQPTRLQPQRVVHLVAPLQARLGLTPAKVLHSVKHGTERCTESATESARSAAICVLTAPGETGDLDLEGEASTHAQCCADTWHIVTRCLPPATSGLPPSACYPKYRTLVQL